jgi:hypothetical protein
VITLRVKMSAGPPGYREFLTATSPAGSSAISTQFPLGLLRLLLVHVTLKSDAGMPFQA